MCAMSFNPKAIKSEPLAGVVLIPAKQFELSSSANVLHSRRPPRSSSSTLVGGQARHWIGTIPHHCFVPYLPPGVACIKGQLESGASSDFVHWQLVVTTERKRRLRWLRDTFGPYHFEPTRSAAASAYVWKDDTAIAGTRFELGTPPTNRSSAADWNRVWDLAASGRLDEIPCDIRVRCYHQLRRIASDHIQPPPMPRRRAFVFWGPSSTGKSFRARQEAGPSHYVKDPRTKWFCGHLRQSSCIIDEFRGAIDVTHLLRWFDPYPVSVETKGGSVPLFVETFYLTSNLHPTDWYPMLDSWTQQALLRRLVIIEMSEVYVPPEVVE